MSENATKLNKNNFYHDNDEPDVFQRKDKSQLLQNKSQFLHDLNKNFERLFNDLGLFRSDLEKTQIQMNELTVNISCKCIILYILFFYFLRFCLI